MMATWDIAELRGYIDASLESNHRLYGVVNAIARYDWIFQYHFSTARDAMKGIMHYDDPHGIKNMEFVFGLHEQQIEFNQAKLISEAHILGCIHCVRAMYDIFSHLVDVLILNEKIGIKNCDIKKIEKALPSSGLKTELRKLLNSKWFKYIDAFINTAKHRGLVQHEFRISFVDETSGIRLAPFKYDKKEFDTYSTKELLKGVLEVKNRIAVCGQILNTQVISGRSVTKLQTDSSNT